LNPSCFRQLKLDHPDPTSEESAPSRTRVDKDTNGGYWIKHRKCEI